MPPTDSASKASGDGASIKPGATSADSADAGLAVVAQEKPESGATGVTNSGFRVTAIVVTYNPDLDVLRRLLKALESQLDSIVIVDNASSQQDKIATLADGITCYLLPSNLGLGKAHNLGIEFAKSRASTHVLLLDQDSLPDQGMLREMSVIVKQLERDQVRYSGLGCRYRLQCDSTQASDFVRVSWFRFSRVKCQAQPYVKADFLISSGTLIPIQAIENVGLMDESLFIDHVDTEWFMRANSLGYGAYGCCHAFMEHALGETTTRIWFLRHRLVPYHRPFRYYYIFRNSLLLYKRRYMPRKWMVADWVRLLQNFIFFGIFAAERGSNLKMMWKGFVDGIKGVSGYRSGLIIKDG